MKVVGAFVAIASALASVAAAGMPWPLADGSRREPDSTQAVLILLNSPEATSPDIYARAALKAASDARDGANMQRFLLAALSTREGLLPPGAVLDVETRKAYYASSRAKIVEMAGKRCNALACYLLSIADDDRAMLERAASLGNVQAMNAFGMAILRDDGARARALFERAAASGDANGLYNFGSCLADGVGGAKDEKRALECFSKAAAAGHPLAHNNLGRFYREGIATARDPVAAAEHFATAAALGSVTGQFNYAMALLAGEGVQKNPARAAALLETAAEAGSVEAMETLSKCYGDGAGGMERDAKRSLLWLVRSRAARGDGNARKWLEANKEGLE